MVANYKHTSPFTVTNFYTKDHSKIPGYPRNYDPIKQYFCLLPRNDTSRPLIVLQEELIQVDDLLFPCNILKQIVKPLTVNKHPLSSPLEDEDTSYYTTLSKLARSYNELYPKNSFASTKKNIQISTIQYTSITTNLYELTYLCSKNFRVLETPILPLPSSMPHWVIPTAVTSYYQDFAQYGSTSGPLLKK